MRRCGRSPARSFRRRWFWSPCSLPVAFLPGISGQLFRQFAVTMTASVADLRAQCANAQPGSVRHCCWSAPRRRAGRSNGSMPGSIHTRTAIPRITGLLARRSLVAGLIVVLIGGGAYWMFGRTPTAFIPTEDQGVLFVNVQLPDAASLPRTQAVLDAGQAKSLERPMALPTSSPSPATASFPALSAQYRPGSRCDETMGRTQHAADRTARHLRQPQCTHFGAIGAANIIAFPPPAIPGIGNAEGFDFRLEALGGQSPEDLSQVVRSLIVAANADPRIGKRLFDILRGGAWALSRYRPRQRRASQRAGFHDLQHAASPARLGATSTISTLWARPTRSISMPTRLPLEGRRHPQPVCPQQTGAHGAGAVLRDGQQRRCSRRCSIATTSSLLPPSTASRQPESRRAPPCRR